MHKFYSLTISFEKLNLHKNLIKATPSLRHSSANNILNNNIIISLKTGVVNYSKSKSAEKIKMILIY